VADPGGAGYPYFWQSQFNIFLHCIQCLKNVFEIEFGFYSGWNPRSFWKCGGVCARVWIEIVAATVFCSAKAQFWVISEAILIPKIYARLQVIASNFSKFSAGGPQTPRRRSPPYRAPLTKIPGSAPDSFGLSRDPADTTYQIVNTQWFTDLCSLL